MQDDDFARCNHNRRHNLLGLVDALVTCLHFESMTSRPGWKFLAEQLGVHRATVARLLATLKNWGFLGVVATGRQAEWAPKAADGEYINEAAVYVLCVPSKLALAPEPENLHVEENATLSAVGGSHLEEKKLTHTRAREKNLNTDVAPPRPMIESAASGAPTAQIPWRPEIQWPTHRTPKRRIQRLAAAAEIRNRSFPLRCMSSKDVASSCRDFFLAGWTVADVLHALDRMPDGTLWPHSGAPKTRDPWRMRGWLRHRLSAWRTDAGEPLRSRDQQAANRHAESRREQEAERRRVLERQAEHAARLTQGDSPAKVTALAQIHSIFDSNRRKGTR